MNKAFLVRQIMHTTTRVDELKCVSLAKSLQELNPNLKVSFSNALFTTRVDELKYISLAKSLHSLNPNLKVSLKNALFTTRVDELKLYQFV